MIKKILILFFIASVQMLTMKCAEFVVQLHAEEAIAINPLLDPIQQLDPTSLVFKSLKQLEQLSLNELAQLHQEKGFKEKNLFAFLVTAWARNNKTKLARAACKAMRPIVFDDHQSAINDIALTQNDTLITASEDNTTKIWGPDCITLLNYRYLGAQGLPGTLSVGSLSNGNIATGNRDGTIKLWGPDGKFIKNIQTDVLQQGNLTILPNDTFIAQASANTVKIWDKDGNEITVINTGEVNFITVLPSNTLFVSNAQDAYILDFTGKKLATLLGVSDVVCVVPLPQDHIAIELLIGDSWRQKLKTVVAVSDLQGNSLGHLEGYSGIGPIKVLSDGKLVTATHTGAVTIWHNNVPFKTLQASGIEIKALHILSGDLIAIGNRRGELKIWDKDGNLIANIQAHEDEITKIISDSNGNIITCSVDSTAKKWSFSDYLLTIYGQHQTTLEDLCLLEKSDFNPTIPPYIPVRQPRLTPKKRCISNDEFMAQFPEGFGAKELRELQEQGIYLQPKPDGM